MFCRLSVKDERRRPVTAVDHPARHRRVRLAAEPATVFEQRERRVKALGPLEPVGERTVRIPLAEGAVRPSPTEQSWASSSTPSEPMNVCTARVGEEVVTDPGRGDERVPVDRFPIPGRRTAGEME